MFKLTILSKLTGIPYKRARKIVNSKIVNPFTDEDFADVEKDAIKKEVEKEISKITGEPLRLERVDNDNTIDGEIYP